METTWERVLAWRMRRQFLADRDAPDAVAVARRLVGVQAQVPSAAAQAVAVRRADVPTDGADVPTDGAGVDDAGVDEALRAGTLLRTWAMRGTLHLLAADQAPAVLSLLAEARSWHKGTWQRTFATAAQMDALAAAARDVLADGAVLTRDELVAALVAHADAPGLAEALSSGWGTLLKPLAWQGLLCGGPPNGSRVTFTSPATAVPGWPGLPDADVAARTVVPAYLAAHGPATPAALDAWLLRGSIPKARLRAWFAGLVDDGVLARVTVAGSDGLYACTADLDDLADAAPVPGLRLLGGFDPYVLGAGTSDPHVVPPEGRDRVSRPGGWISPVVLDAGRVVATWSVDGDRLAVEAFGDPPDPAALDPDALDPDALDAAALDAERAAWSRVLGRPLTA